MPNRSLSSRQRAGGWRVVNHRFCGAEGWGLGREGVCLELGQRFGWGDEFESVVMTRSVVKYGDVGLDFGCMLLPVFGDGDNASPVIGVGDVHGDGGSVSDKRGNRCIR